MRARQARRGEDRGKLRGSPRARLWNWLAARTGEPLSTLKAKWTEREFRELAIYLSHEPPLESRIDFWASQLLAAAINPWRKKGSAAVSPKDLIPDWWKDENAGHSVSEWVDMLRNMTVVMGGKVDNGAT